MEQNYSFHSLQHGVGLLDEKKALAHLRAAPSQFPPPAAEVGIAALVDRAQSVSAPATARRTGIGTLSLKRAYIDICEKTAMWASIARP